MFLLAAALSGSLLLLRNPNWTNVVLVIALAWSSARFYYFAFYVVQRWVDPQYRFSGIRSLIVHFVAPRR